MWPAYVQPLSLAEAQNEQFVFLMNNSVNLQGIRSLVIKEDGGIKENKIVIDETADKLFGKQISQLSASPEVLNDDDPFDVMLQKMKDCHVFITFMYHMRRVLQVCNFQ